MRQKAVVYARVSTDHDEQQNSLKSQEKYYTQYVKDKGYEFVDLYSDEGLSATSSNRKAFIEMLTAAGLDATRGDGNLVTFVASQREPKFDWIIIKDLDRFARNLDTIAVIRALRDKGVYIEFESLDITTKSVDWELRVGLLLTFAQQESLDKSRKIKDAFKKKAERGEFHMSVNLLGYSRDKKTKEYYIVEDQAKIVRLMFDLYTKELKGSYEIGDILNAKGYKTKLGRQWTGNSVGRMLKNEKFKGQVILQKYGRTDITGTNKRVINPISDWVILDDMLPKIVSVEQFDKAQEIMATRTRSTVKNKGSDKRQVRGQKIIRNVFHEKIICGICQSDYIRESTLKTRRGKKVREYFYGCRNRRNTQRNRKKCTNRGISHNVLVRELITIGKKLADDRFNEWYIADERKALHDRLDEIDEQVDGIDNQKSRIDEEIEQMDIKKNNLFNTLSSGASDTITRLTHQKMEEYEKNKIELAASKVKFSLSHLENEKVRLGQKFDDIILLSKKSEYTFEELLKQIAEISILNTGRVLVKFSTPTLITNIPQTGSFLHSDADGNPTIMYWFDR